MSGICPVPEGPRDRGRQCRQVEEGEGERASVARSCCVQYVFTCRVFKQHLLRAAGWVRFRKDCETGEVPALRNSCLVEKPHQWHRYTQWPNSEGEGRSKVLGGESPGSPLPRAETLCLEEGKKEGKGQKGVTGNLKQSRLPLT